MFVLNPKQNRVNLFQNKINAYIPFVSFALFQMLENSVNGHFQTLCLINSCILDQRKDYMPLPIFCADKRIHLP